MFNNECLGRLDYEATTSAIVMAGLFLAFLFEFVGHRIVLARNKGVDGAHACSRGWSPNSASDAKEERPGVDVTEPLDEESQPGQGGSDRSPEAVEASNRTALANLGHNHGSALDPSNPNSKLSVLVMEAGVLFHSILIGLTLVVAGDSFYRTLLVVIVFHQFFEGLALGARIATLPRTTARFWPTKFVMAMAFALITPIGMAIGLGVIHEFNGNARSTILAIGTLDALSAGVLIWVGVVDMWARDWILPGSEFAEKDASFAKIVTGLLSLIVGFVAMSVLGKWA